MFLDLLMWGIILQVLLGVGFGLVCAYLSWGGPRDPDAADLIPAPAPQRVRHDTHLSWTPGV